ncbi:polysaccharide biosynthesis/export family protein [Parafrankia sp. BMG5.11]|uniref:polysaccharide biosynthesis/export family protein n=1 Tax=Parafrankia sp. BMG5.11 TaxID=222540 RepID=UPI00103CC137|nr:polysaccharide biosynthesis/export family protein [Parafrankia sp. BMG5.11]TCJ34968.1 sugar transporter [Parafrankia sp. BMG5.11]
MKHLFRTAGPLALCVLAVASPAAAQNQPSEPVRSQPTSSISSYQIKAGDQIEVYVWGEERLQRSMRVLPDGTIAFPLVGQVAVAGRLPQEVETVIRASLSSQYRGEVPQVTVSVLTPAPMQFTVLGRVGSPGTFETVRNINVLEALSLAGGGTEFANLDRIVVLRKTPDGLRVLEANVKALMRGRVDAADLVRANIVPIEAGDTIIVP